MKNHSRVSFSLSTVGVMSMLAACEGIIEDPSGLYALSDETSESSVELDASVAEPEEDTEPEPETSANSGAHVETSAVQSQAVQPKARPTIAAAQQPTAAAPSQAAPPATAPVDLATRVGTGDLATPLAGPAPVEAAHLTGAPYKLVKNWDFGANGTIRSRADLEAEFQFHDQFKTIANGTNYGAVTVASCRETAIGASGLGLPSDDQPIEDEADPTREWTGDTMLSHVRPLSKSQETVSAARHDAGNGSLMAKWSLPNGGALLGQDMVWETRVRMPKPLPGFWFALWTAGDRWSKGAEMDVVESFGTPNINFDAFHSDSVGGTNMVEYKAWPDALDEVGVPDEQRELSDWHTWTWVYNKDDSYEVFYDGHRVQHGVIHWTDGGGQDGNPIDMRFLFDFSWGHTQVNDVNIELPASMFPLTYEIDYSRVYLR